jgi:hypothetical protein
MGLADQSEIRTVSAVTTALWAVGSDPLFATANPSGGGWGRSIFGAACSDGA